MRGELWACGESGASYKQRKGLVCVQEAAYLFGYKKLGWLSLLGYDTELPRCGVDKPGLEHVRHKWSLHLVFDESRITPNTRRSTCEYLPPNKVRQSKPWSSLPPSTSSGLTGGCVLMILRD